MDMFTPLLLEVAPEIHTNPTSFYRWRGRGGRLRLQTPVIGSRPALAMSVHPTYFDLATPLIELLLLIYSTSTTDDARELVARPKSSLSLSLYIIVGGVAQS